jgi:PAS domain S-box-containing protein
VGSRRLDVAGQAWTLVARSRPGFERQSHQRHAPLVLVGGIGLSLIAALIDRLLARARHAQARLSDMRDAVRRGERMHQLAVEQVSDHAIFRVDPDGRLASWNRGVERVLGWRSADFIGQPYAAIFTPEDAGDDLPERELRAARTGEVTSTERWHLRHDGTRLRAAVTTTTLTDRQDRFAGLLVVMRDITERALAEERFRTLVDDAPVLVWRSDVTGACTWFNKQWLAFTGRSMEQELGGGWAASVHPGDLDRCLRTHRAALSAQEPFSMEYRLRRHDGEWRWIVDNGQPVFSGPSRELTGFIGSCVDVHESRAAATALAEQRRTLLEVERSARQEAERVGRMKDEFLATLSHELRTPLNAILGWAQLLVRGAARPEETQRGLDVIVRNARAQAQIIEDLLDMSRIVSGKVRLEMERVDLAAVVEAALDVVRPAAEARGVALRTSLPQGLPPVDADPHRLQQVLWNLLTNAVKFTPRDGEVRVSLVGEDDTIALRVTDTGQGIAPEFLPHVFERFRQADASITRQHGGLGLGLAIVRSIVEMHGGSIAAESGGADRGATFVARLPIARSAAPDGPRSRPVEGKVRETAGHRLRGVSVLVVDDDPDGRELTRIGLERDGALVRLAGSATEALQVLRGEAPAPDVVISDLAMPAMGGFEFGGAVRELPGSRVSRVPLIALTALASPDHRVRAIAAGFDAYLTKPLDREALVQIVAALAGAPASD